MARMGDLRYATDLVAFIREEHGDHFRDRRGLLPGNPSAGRRCASPTCAISRTRSTPAPSSAITQYFYNTDAYFRFVDDARKLGITVPIIPGIMPISNFTQLKRFSRSLRRRDPALDRQAHGRATAMTSTASVSSRPTASPSMCRRLIEAGVPELHFYTLNLSKPTEAVIARLR